MTETRYASLPFEVLCPCDMGNVYLAGTLRLPESEDSPEGLVHYLDRLECEGISLFSVVDHACCKLDAAFAAWMDTLKTGGRPHICAEWETLKPDVLADMNARFGPLLQMTFTHLIWKS